MARLRDDHVVGEVDHPGIDDGRPGGEGQRVDAVPR
jgi:hypothetical protein